MFTLLIIIFLYIKNIIRIKMYHFFKYYKLYLKKKLANICQSSNYY